MDTKSILESLKKELQECFPNVQLADEEVDVTVKHIEQTYYSCLLGLIQKDETFFNEPRMLYGVNLSDLWKEDESKHDAIWKFLQMSVFSSFLHGDIKQKIGTIFSAVKGVWNMSGQENDDISKILNDEESEGHFMEIFEYLQNTRIAKMFMEIVENFDIEELELNLDNPQEIMDILRNPEHPVMKKVITKIKNVIQQKMQRGEISQQMITSEVEGIKAKLQSLFGNVFNDMLGGRRADVPSTVLMSNSPEARRQRMLARLQKKQRDKNSH
jgi:hypothetical protein